MGNKIFGNEIMPLKDEISDRDTPVINKNEILFRDNLNSIKTRLVLFSVLSIFGLIALIYNSCIKIDEEVFGLEKFKLCISNLNQGYKMLFGLLCLFAIVSLISLYAYFIKLKKGDEFLFKVTNVGVAYKEDKLYWSDENLIEWDYIEKIYLIEIFKSYYKDKSVYSDRKKIVVVLKNKKVIQDTYYPSSQNTIYEAMLFFVPKEIEIKCFENIIGQENLNI
jgi:hypothetical protein